MSNLSVIDSKKSRKNTTGWLSGNVLLLGLVSFFADVSGEMMTPVLPLFIAALGGSSLVIGFIGGLGDAVANIMKVFSGYLADKTGRRRRLIAIGYGIPFFVKLGIGFSNAWQQVMVLKPTERLGKGIRGAPRDSLLADSVLFESRGKAFGFHRMMDTAGAILGSFLALGIVLLFFNVLNDELGILKLIIIISAFISLAAVVPIFFLSDPKEAKFVDERRISFIQNLKTLPKAYYKFLFVSLLFGLANFTVLLFIFHTKMVVLGIDENSSPLLQIIITIGVFIWFNIIYTILSTPFGSWSDKYGRKVIFSIGLVLFVITCFGFLIVSSLILLILFFGIYGAFMAATDGIQKAFVVDLLPPDLKGTGIGLLQTLVGFAGIIGGLIAGFLYEFNFNLTFIYGGTIALISLIILLITDFTPRATLNS